MREFIIAVLTVLALSINAQEDVENYFDDGNLSNPSLIVKPNIASFLGGDFSLGLEYILLDNLSIEAGVGKINHYFNLVGTMDDDFSFQNINGGFSFRICPKFYLRKAPEYNYWGPMFRYRKYNFSDRTIVTKEFALTWGVQLSFGKRFYFDYGLGLGLNYGILEYDSGEIEKTKSYCLPITLAVGIAF